MIAQNKQQTKTAAYQRAWDELRNDPEVTARLSRQIHGINSSTDLNVVLREAETSAPTIHAEGT